MLAYNIYNLENMKGGRNMSNIREYDAIFFRQPGNPNYIMANLVIGVSDLVEWVFCPRKTTQDGEKILFQRALDNPRLEKLKLHYEKCITPNSILITLSEGAVCNLDEIDNTVDDTSQPKIGKLKLNINLLDNLDLKSKISIVVSRLQSRLQGDVENNYKNEEIDDSENEDIDENIQTIKSHLKETLERLANILKNIEKTEELDSETEMEVSEFCDSYLKPGLLVDGQHRVYGAYEKIAEKWEVDGDYEILLPVSAIINSDWKESVFQFVIINQTAQKIDNKFLSSIISTSLTESELDEFRDQFENSGAYVGEAVALNKLNDKEIYIDDKNINPFYNNIEFGIKNESKTAIRYNTVRNLMNKLIKFSSSSATTSFGNPYSNLKDIIQDKLGLNIDTWYEDDYWLQFMIYFRYLVEDQFTSDKKLKFSQYSEDVVGSSNISLKVSMNYLQDSFIDNLIKNYKLYEKFGKKIKIEENMLDYKSFKEIFDLWIDAQDDKDYKFFETEWKGLASFKRESDKYEGIHTSFTSKHYNKTKLFKG